MTNPLRGLDLRDLAIIGGAVLLSSGVGLTVAVTTGLLWAGVGVGVGVAGIIALGIGLWGLPSLTATPGKN